MILTEFTDIDIHQDDKYDGHVDYFYAFPFFSSAGLEHIFLHTQGESPEAMALYYSNIDAKEKPNN